MENYDYNIIIRRIRRDVRTSGHVAEADRCGLDLELGAPPAAGAGGAAHVAALDPRQIARRQARSLNHMFHITAYRIYTVLK